MDLSSLEQYAKVAESLVVIVGAAMALWAWWKELRAKSLREIVPAVVALVQDAARDYHQLHGKSMPDKAKLAADTFARLAAERGIKPSTPEVAHALTMASALHKHLKLAETGYTGAPPADPPAAPGTASPSPGASSPGSAPAVLPGTP